MRLAWLTLLLAGATSLQLRPVVTPCSQTTLRSPALHMAEGKISSVLREKLLNEIQDYEAAIKAEEEREIAEATKKAKAKATAKEGLTTVDYLLGGGATIAFASGA